VLNDQLPAGISVVVPVYEAATRLDELSRRLLAVLQRMGRAAEVVLVNDGSVDDSWERITDLARREPTVRGIDLVRNVGQHNALLAGIRSARFDVTVTLDDDLQHPPEEIPKLLAALNGDVDVVYGAAVSKRQSVPRRIASLITRIGLQRMMGVEVARDVSAFRAFRTSVRRAFESFALPEFSIDVLLSWGARRYASVAVAHHPRSDGTSGYTTRSLLAHSINMVIGYSLAPLRLASVLGFAAVALAVGLLSYLFVHYILSGTSVPGFLFIAASVCLFGGVQLLMLGVIGEYLAKVFQGSMGRTPYAVRAVTAQDGS